MWDRYKGRTISLCSHPGCTIQTILLTLIQVLITTLTSWQCYLDNGFILPFHANKKIIECEMCSNTKFCKKNKLREENLEIETDTFEWIRSWMKEKKFE